MVFLCTRKCRWITPFVSQKTVHIFWDVHYSLRAVSWTFSSLRNSHVTTLWTAVFFYLGLVVMTPHLITSNHVIQESATFSLLMVRYIQKNLHIVFFLFPCVHSWDPLSTDFVIFQHCCYHFQCIQINIQPCTQFPGFNLLICVGELIKMLFS